MLYLLGSKLRAPTLPFCREISLNSPSKVLRCSSEVFVCFVVKPLHIFRGIIFKSMRAKLLKLTLLLIIFITLVHAISLEFYLYLDFWWLDIIMHFLSGFWLVLFVLWILFFAVCWKVNWQRINTFFLIFSVLVFNLAVGTAWEFFEFKLGITSFSSFYWLNTISDILSNLAGGFLAALIFYRSVLINPNLYEEQ